ncbi:slx4 endonuclease domain-containing protein [Sarocladium implicatum]|nr:slx4 endonuclease domain-containing protein [Sarocladium implicatum]
MASPDVFLSSPRVTRRMVHAIGTSSPELPEIDDLVRTQKSAKPSLKSGSRAAAIPDDALQGFTTARGLWQSAQAADESSGSSILQTADPIYLSGEDDSICIVEPPKKPVNSVSNSRKPRCRKEPTPEAPLHSIASPAKAPSPRTPSKDQPWRKYRPSPGSLASSPSSQRFFHDAPPSAQVPLEEPRLLETESVSKHFKTKRDAKKIPGKAVAVPDEPLALETAPLRRLDWTPPAREVSIVHEPTHEDGETKERNAAGSDVEKSAVDFRDLLQTYSCETNGQLTSTGSSEAAGGLGKRKLIEPVLIQETSTSGQSRSASPAKKKGPKKPRTITDLATAAYRIQEEPEPPPPASLMNFYVTASQGIDGTSGQKGGKGKTKTKKRAPPKASKKKAAPPKPVLLSPGAALKHVADQDFVFGTSSQLAQEKSPTFLRSLHTAMRQSNILDDGAEFQPPLNSDEIEPPQTRPRLWDAAARNEDGGLLDLEVIDLVDASPTLARIPEDADPFGYVNANNAERDIASSPSPPVEEDESLLNLADVTPHKPSNLAKLPADQLPSEPATLKPTMPQAEQSDDHGSEVPQTTQKPVTLADSTPEPTMPALPEQPPRPAYETFTDAQLAKQVSRYGFKPVKRRAAMLALLENCWKSQIASGRLTSASPKRGISTTSTMSAASPPRPRGRPKKSVTTASETKTTSDPVQIVTPAKRPRGRPRKDATQPAKTESTRARSTTPSPSRKGKGRATAKAMPTVPRTVLEIPDSESDQGSAASRSRSASPTSMFSSPSAINLSVSIGDETELSLTMSPTEQQATLFEYISKAVTSAPRSMDTANPSWYEKMLLYDPIVVEDLAVWLNSGRLTSVGHDGEVSPAEVKKWCESKSICCLWRDTQRGKERKRY